MPQLLITAGNVYLDNNVFGITGSETPDGEYCLRSGIDYFGTSGEQVLGGSAVNAALQAQRLGLEVAFVGKTGADEAGHEVRRLFEIAGILPDLLIEDPAQRTAIAINLVGRDGEFIGVHYGAASRTLEASDFNLAHPLFERASGIYFGGTTKQALFRQCEALFQALADQGLQIFYDPNRLSAEESELDAHMLKRQLRNVEIYFPNEGELLQGTGAASVDEALAEVMSTGVRCVALKLGPRGCRVKTADDDFVVAGHRVEPVTTVGAGDCFNATFIFNYLRGADLRTCAEKATAAAAIKVARNVWPDRAAIEAALLRQ